MASPLRSAGQDRGKAIRRTGEEMRARSWMIAVAMFSTLALMGSFLGRRGGSIPHLRPPARSEAADSLPVPGVPEEVAAFLRNGQSWRAARLMREFLDRTPDAAPEAVLLAARAEAGWGGWARTRAYLEDRPWLDRVNGGEGWFWLARARERDEAWEPALEAYTRYLAGEPAADDADRPRVAELRRGLILLRLGRAGEAAGLLEGLREHAPEIAPLGERAGRRGARRTGRYRPRAGRSSPAREDAPAAVLRRGRRALLDALQEAGDRRAARDLALAFAAGRESASGQAELSLRAARLSLALGDSAGAVRGLRAAMEASTGSSAAREAALLLEELPRRHHGRPSGDRARGGPSRGRPLRRGRLPRLAVRRRRDGGGARDGADEPRPGALRRPATSPAPSGSSRPSPPGRRTPSI